MADWSSKDERFLALVRRTLAAVARDTAPTAGRPHLLKNDTIQMMRDCFAAVSEREHEYRRHKNAPSRRPYYPHDRPRTPITRLFGRRKSKPPGSSD